ncbi:putative acetyltransferase [Pseudomonas phage Bertil]|uniref:Putative acetyltransferase n=1 Tax=Pseudomonas phage Bertil TaxID=2801385 RepID=A0A7T8EQI5_9CAUD|nr:putative acetyltransferase [Pseudomonas phage Bertil]QQO90873.1 putative acyltransferase [Pseudomonas phage Strit]
MSKAGIILRVAISTFMGSLELAQRNRELVREHTDTPADVALKVSKAFWGEHTKPEQITRFERDPLGHKAKLDAFYQDRCIVNVVFDGNERTGGYIVLDGELLALHSQIKSRGNWLLDHAIKDGAKHLVCSDTAYLRSFYEGRGFIFSGWQSNWTEGQPPLLRMGLPVNET